MATQVQPKVESPSVVTDFVCGCCKSFAQCVKDTKQALEEATEEAKADPTNEKLQKEVTRAENAIPEADSEPCDEFDPNGAIPNSILQAFALVAKMTLEEFNLFNWKLETLLKVRELEDQFNIRIGEKFTIGKTSGIVADIRPDGRIVIVKPDGKKMILRTSMAKNIEDDE